MAKHNWDFEWTMAAQKIDHKPLVYNRTKEGFVVEKDAFPSINKSFYSDLTSPQFMSTLVYRVAFMKGINVDRVLEVDSDRVKANCDIIQKRGATSKHGATLFASISLKEKGSTH